MTWLFAVVCGLLLLDIPLFVYLHHVPAIVPKYWAVLLGLLAIGAGGLRGALQPRVLALGAAAALYLGYCILSVGWSANSDAAARELVTRATGLALLLLVASVTAATRGPQQRIMLAAAAMLAVVFLLADVAQGYPWSSVTGRAAGTFANPNIAAASTFLLGALGVRAVPGRWRAPFLAVVTLGVVSTLSRGGYLMLALGAVLLPFRDVVRWRDLARTAVLAVAVALAAWPVARTVLADRPELAILEAVDPVALLRLDRGDATSASERQEVAVAALELVAEHPMFGAGLTATTTWTLPVSTHNQLLRTAAELGVVGVAVILVLLSAIIIGGRVLRTPEGPVVLCWIAVLLLVSHNVLEDWSHLAGLGVLAGLEPDALPPTAPPVEIAA